MNSTLPKISIITPSYNQGEFLEDTIKSIIEQNYPNLEYIIIDGGSTDKSVKIIKKYESHLTYWVSEKDNGQTAAINKGFKIATGDIIAWLNSDDFYYPGALNLIAEMYSSDPKAGLYIGNGAVADKKGNRIRRYSHNIIFDYDTLLKGSNYILQPSTFINAKAINEVGYLDESLHYAMDLEYWFRVASKFGVLTVNEELSAYRWYDEIKTKTGGLKRWVEQWGIINKYSNLQITPGLLVEFFNVLQEKEVIDHFGLDISDFSNKVKMQFYQTMQQMLNMDECIPRKGNGKIYSSQKNNNNIKDTKSSNISSINILKSNGSNPKLDIVLQVTGEHAWGVGKGWENAAKKIGVHNKTFAPKANWNDSNLQYDDGLEKYLKENSSDILFLAGFDWHSQALHKNGYWKELFLNSNAKKVLYVQESLANNCRLFNTDEMKLAFQSAAEIADLIVYTDFSDKDFIESIKLPSIWQPFGVDDSVFYPKVNFGNRIHKPFFRGKYNPFYTDATYEERRKLLKYLFENHLIDLIPYTDKPVNVEEIASDYNKYKIAINLPSIFSNHPTRVYEALACGNALITNRTNIKKIDDLFEDKEHLIYYNDQESLRDAIDLLQNDNNLLVRISQKGSDYVKENFTLDKHLFAILKELQSIVSAKNNDSVKTSITSNIKGNKIIIDGVIFQIQQNRPVGISRVWLSLLSEIGKTEFRKNILLLDRENTSPYIEGIEKRVINFYNKYYPNADAKYLEDICNEEKADLFISTYYTYTTETRYLMMLHDFIPEITGMDLSNPEWISKINSINRASEYFSISVSTKNDFVKNYPDKANKNISIINNAVSDNFKLHSEKEITAFKKKYNIIKPYYILCGNRTGYKNFILFFKAAALLKDKNKFEIVLTGGNPKLEDEFKPFFKGIKYSIFYLSDQELSVALSGAISMVYPSKYEGFGLPILEAMKSGCPVITCKNSSIPEVAGNAAYYVNEDDVPAMKDILIRVRSKSVRDPLIEKGIINAKRFSWKTSANLLLAKIKEILKTHNGLTDHEIVHLDNVNKLIYKIWSTPRLMNAYKTLGEQFFLGPKADLSKFINAENEFLSLDSEVFESITLENIMQNPQEAYRFFFMGLYCQNKNRWEEAFNYYVVAFKLGMSHWRTGYLASLMAVNIKNYSFALKVLPEVLKAKPNYTEAKELLDSIKDKSTKLKVSAIVSTYNSEKFIRGCLEDLINQTLFKKGQLEIVVVNTGSEQNEKNIVAEFQKRYSNINYIETENRQTIYSAWNIGIKACRGNLITNANTDDRHRHDALEIMAAAFAENSEIDVVYADSYLTTKPNDNWNSKTPKTVTRWASFDRDIILFGCFLGPQPMWKKSMHERYGYFNEELRIVGDYEFWLRISRTAKFLHLNENLGLYFYSPESAEHKNKSLTDDENTKVQHEYFIKYIPDFNEIIRIKNKLAPVKNANDGEQYFKMAMDLLEKRENGLFIQASIAEFIRRSNDNSYGDIIKESANILTQVRTNNSIIDHAYLENFYLILAIAEFKSTKFNEAKKQFENALLENKNSTNAYAGLGEVYYAAGDYKQALIYFERAIKIDPNNKIALNGVVKSNNKIKDIYGQYDQELKIEKTKEDGILSFK